MNSNRSRSNNNNHSSHNNDNTSETNSNSSDDIVYRGGQPDQAMRAARRIRIAANVTEILEGTFAEFSSLIEVTFEKNSQCTQIHHWAFAKCEALRKIILPKGLEVIGNCAFRGCFVLQNIEIPASCKTILRYAFSNCRGLQTVKFLTTGDNCPPQLVGIGRQAFSCCSSLVSIINLERAISLDIIHDQAFCGCHQLQSLHLPPNVKTIRHDAFGCKGLKVLGLPLHLSAFGGHPRWSDWVQPPLAQQCPLLEHAIIPPACQTLTNCFHSHPTLKRVELLALNASTSTQLLKNQFLSCSSLEHVIFPQDLFSARLPVALWPRLFQKCEMEVYNSTGENLEITNRSLANLRFQLLSKDHNIASLVAVLETQKRGTRNRTRKRSANWNVDRKE